MSSAYVKLPHDSRPCVCSICICGRHNCPGVFCMQPLGGSSSYRDTYTPKKGERDLSPRGRAPPIATKAPPGHFLTTYQASCDPVIKAPLERITPYRPSNALAPSAHFDGTTTQRVDFKGHNPKLPPRPPLQAPLPKVAGIYDTTLGAMQQPVVDAIRSGMVQRAISAGHKAQNMPHLPFDATTSYRVQYPPKSAEQNQQFTPRTNSAGVKENRDFITTKSLSFPPPPLVQRPPCPAALVPIRPPSRDGHIKVSQVPVM